MVAPTFIGQMYGTVLLLPLRVNHKEVTSWSSCDIEVVLRVFHSEAETVGASGVVAQYLPYDMAETGIPNNAFFLKKSPEC